MSSRKNAVLTVSSSITINAPHDVVRDVLFDFASYSDWYESLNAAIALSLQHSMLPRNKGFLYVSWRIEDAVQVRSYPSPLARRLSC
ncbi:hypothetical protein PENSPDRAFT_655934 [Peniophora sp. CONT]|nr:hypothetical protein PENSPDRAFT_655934 [Peniophora sp. CONT]